MHHQDRLMKDRRQEPDQNKVKAQRNPGRKEGGLEINGLVVVHGLEPKHPAPDFKRRKIRLTARELFRQCHQGRPTIFLRA